VHFVGEYASVPIFCHHCEEASCAMLCFTGALHKEGERTAFDITKCTGCGLCHLACPFGVVWTDKIAHKCDLCAGLDSPICIKTCPANALSTDFEEEARRARTRSAIIAARGGRR